MKNKNLSIIIPCLVMCALAFIDAPYGNLSPLNILTMGCAVVTVASIAYYLIKSRGK